jgi:putative ABC transport system permease protein
VGSDIRDALGLKPGGTVTLGFGPEKTEAKVAGFVQRGGPEDGSVMMGLRQSQKLAGLEGKLSAVLVRAVPGGIEGTVRLLGERMPEAEVKTLRQVAFAEESFLGKIELLMVLVTLVVVLTTGISVSSTMSATVLERMKEIGLMMAIGGTRRRIRRFYLAEGCIIGLAGGLVGYVAGFGAAQAVSKGAFGSYISVPFHVLPVALFLGVALAVSSSFLPLADALRNSPSDILRGE